MREYVRIAPVFGGRVVLRASGVGSTGLSSPAALVLVEALLRRIHALLTPFTAASELSRLNADPADTVAAGPVVARLCAAVGPAGELSGGLVDATYASPERPHGAWRSVVVHHGRVSRPPGVVIDPCGLAKGLAADLVASRLAGHPSFAVDCLGDLRTGGTAGRSRPIAVADPLGGAEPIARLHVRDGAVATSGTTRRPGHLIDPRTGAPAQTGIVQATALAPTGLEAEIRAKAALLAGRVNAERHLPHGGVLLLSCGEVLVVEPAGGGSARRRPGAMAA